MNGEVSNESSDQTPVSGRGGEHSFLPQNELQEMVTRIPHGRYVQIPGTGHDLHLEQPQAWRQATEAFLQTL